MTFPRKAPLELIRHGLLIVYLIHSAFTFPFFHYSWKNKHCSKHWAAGLSSPSARALLSSPICPKPLLPNLLSFCPEQPGPALLLLALQGPPSPCICTPLCTQQFWNDCSFPSLHPLLKSLYFFELRLRSDTLGRAAGCGSESWFSDSEAHAVKLHTMRSPYCWILQFFSQFSLLQPALLFLICPFDILAVSSPHLAVWRLEQVIF